MSISDTFGKSSPVLGELPEGGRGFYELEQVYPSVSLREFERAALFQTAEISFRRGEANRARQPDRPTAPEPSSTDGGIAASPSPSF